MSQGFRTAAELDDYIANLTDDERAEVHRPTAYRDQLNAAAHEGISIAEDLLGHKGIWVPHSGIVEWVRLGMLDALLRWMKGQALTCIHRPHPDRPEPVFAAAWKPGVVVCADCVDMLSVAGTVADTICDGCGHECQGLPDDGITPFTTFVGSLGYEAGVCDSCDEDVRRAERESKCD
jgi:hypothetical protein